MESFKLLNIAGIFIEIIGVLVIAKTDLLTRLTNAAFEEIPGNPFVDHFNATMNDEPYSPSEKEREFLRLSNQSNAKRSVFLFRLSLVLILCGMSMQLIAAIFGP